MRKQVNVFALFSNFFCLFLFFDFFIFFRLLSIVVLKVWPSGLAVNLNVIFLYKLFYIWFFCSFLLLGIDDVGGSNFKVMSRSRNPLADISNSNSVKKSCLKKSGSIGLDSSLVIEVVNLEKKICSWFYISIFCSWVYKIFFAEG